jgi:bleomycin hydrolase
MNTTKLLLSILLLSGTQTMINAQPADSLKFTIITELPHTSVKNQSHSQTCWSFSGLSFFESEMLRQGKPEVDLSEMFIINHCYQDKAQKFIRMKGNTNFGPGGIFYDLLYVTRNYGLVPEQAYHGIKNSEGLPDHTAMDSMLRKKVEKIIVEKVIPLSWRDTIKKELDSSMGALPDSFSYQGNSYTPKTFASVYCGINPDDYIQITSFEHHPWYKPFILEVPDNWLWSNFYNVPLDELEQIIDYSLKNGYTVAWAADVSEKGFNTTNKGIAVIPEESPSAEEGSDKLSMQEKNISQDMRQSAFDDQETTDDHGMHIIGLAKDQFGKEYYTVKNSWGNYNSYKGYFYASKPYIRYKTTSIMVNKKAIPAAILQKLGI